MTTFTAEERETLRVLLHEHCDDWPRIERCIDMIERELSGTDDAPHTADIQQLRAQWQADIDKTLEGFASALTSTLKEAFTPAR